MSGCSEPLLEIDGRRIETDAEGYLRRLEDWSPAVAQRLAAEDGIELGDAHWQVIGLLREYYHEYRIVPPVRVLVRLLGERAGAEAGNSRYLYRLFPRGPGRQACRYAGLPRPTGCL